MLSKALGLAVNEEPWLMDTDAGEWAGVALKELAKKPEWATVVGYPSGFRFPGGESIQEMYRRVVGTVRFPGGTPPGPGQSSSSRTPIPSRPSWPMPWASTSTSSNG